MKYPRKKGQRLATFFQLALIILVMAGVFASVLQLKQVREFLSRASGEPANIVINTQANLGPLPRPWRNLAQGGEESNWRMNGYTSTVRALNPEYIRIDHIYSFYDVVERSGDQLVFNFSKLDPLLDDIRATGAIPYVSLSYMPVPLSQDDIVGLPKDWNEYQLLIQRTIEHISGTRGFENVYYEVWNEPDLFGGWKTYGDKNYLTLYTYAARGAANARNVRPFKFGGPGITALYENWFTRLSEHATSNNLRYDFFSWHRYDHKLTQYTDDYAKAQAWRARYPQLTNLELHVTEWGHDSRNHPGYDGNYGAAHTVAAAIEMVRQVDKAFVFEIEDGKDPAGNARWGRWGLLTNEEFGIQPKPRYQALRLLDRVGTEQLELTGNGTWVKGLATRGSQNQIQVVLSNYDTNSGNVENVPITFANILPGEYTLSQTFLGGRQNTATIATDSAVLQATVTMPINSVAFIELTPNFDVSLVTPLPPVDLPGEEPRTGFGRLLPIITQ